LSDQHIAEVASLKQRIDHLLIENYRLREHSTGDSVVTWVNKFSPILQLRESKSLASEVQEMWISKKSTGTHPPSALVSLADLQKFLIQFTESYLCNFTSPCWTLKMRNKKFLGREMPSEGMKSTLFGTFGGVNAPELKVMSCETLVLISTFTQRCLSFFLR
jgi:hypothetical protein